MKTKHCASYQLPVEIWREIAAHLSRSQHKVLMQVPHVLGRLSSELFYRNIVLYYGTLPLSLVVYGNPNVYPPDDPLDKWHAERCSGIISRISEDPEFALRVRTLKVYASSRHDEMSGLDALADALPKLKNLEQFACHGTSYALAYIVNTLRIAVPQLKGLHIRYAGSNNNLGPSATPRNLQSLSLAPVIQWPACIEQGLCLKKLRIQVTQRSINFLSHITPLVGMLTHLELYLTPPRLSQALVEIVLRDGTHLESLQFEGVWFSEAPSVSFRRYSHSLPCLKKFAFSVLTRIPPPIDRDLFPAICNFLSNKPDLIALKLVVPTNSTNQANLGFDRRCWDLLPALDSLRALSISLTSLGDSEYFSGFIPRSVTSLALLWDGHYEKVVSMELQGHWPKNLRFLYLYESASNRTARKIATYIPSIRVVQLGQSYYNVVSRVAGEPVQVEQWTSRTEDYFWSEQLEAQGCEDYMLWMAYSHREWVADF